MKARRRESSTASSSILAKDLSALWRARHELRKALRRPASAGSIRRLERKLGLELPHALTALYALHDGTGYGAVDGFYRLLSVAGIAKTKTSLDALERDGHFGDWREHEWWNPAWIPFLDFEGDYVCVDTSTPSGEVLEVRAYSHKQPRLYRSVESWLRTLLELTQLADVAEDLTEHMSTRRATALRKKLNPGYPIVRVARKRPKPRVQKASGVKVEHQSFRRGDYHWMIMRSGAFVRTLFGRSYSGRFANKAFPDEARAKTFVEKSIRTKRQEGYQPIGPMKAESEDVHGTIELAHKHARSSR